MAYSDIILADSPVAYWRLNEASGTSVVDSSGNANHGTYVGTPGFEADGLITGDTDKAVTFSGDDHIVTPIVLNPSTTTFAWEAWVTLSALPSVVGTALVLLSQQDGTGTGRSILYAGPDNQWTSFLGGTATVGGTVAVGVRYHVVVDWDLTTLRIFVNKALIASGTPTAESATGVWIVGASKTLATQWRGVVDEVALYSAPLTAAQRENHYAVGTGSLWSAPVQLFSNGWSSLASGGPGQKLYAIGRNTGSSQLQVRSSTDGVTWSSPVATGITQEPVIYRPFAAVGDTLYLVTRESATPPDCFFHKSTDGGATWSTPLNLSSGNAARKGGRVSIEVDGSWVYIANATGVDLGGGLKDFTASLFISDDGGASFTSKTIADKNDGGGNNPDLAVSADGTLHIVYQNFDNDGTFVDDIALRPGWVDYKSSTDHGATLSAAVRLPGTPIQRPRVEAFGDRVIVVSETSDDVTALPTALRSTRSLDTGLTWSAFHEFTDEAAEVEHAILRIDPNGVIHLPYWDRGGSDATVYRYSDERGVAWSPAEFARMSLAADGVNQPFGAEFHDGYIYVISQEAFEPNTGPAKLTRRVVTETGWEILATVDAALAPPYTVTGLAADSYEFRVIPINDDGESTSNVVTGEITGGGDDHELVTADLAHSHSLDATAISQDHAITPAGVNHSHSVEATSLTQVHALSPAGLEHVNTLDATTVDQSHQITPASLSHAAVLDATTMAQAHVIAPAGLSHGVSLDATTLAQVHGLSPADLANEHALDVSTVTQETDAHTLAAADLTQSHALENATIEQAHQLTPADVGQAQTLDPTTIAQNHALAADDVGNAQALDATALVTDAYQLQPAGLAQSQTVESTTILQVHVLVTDAVLHQQGIEQTTITQLHILIPSDLTNGTVLDATTIFDDTNAPGPLDIVSITQSITRRVAITSSLARSAAITQEV